MARVPGRREADYYKVNAFALAGKEREVMVKKKILGDCQSCPHHPDRMTELFAEIERQWRADSTALAELPELDFGPSQEQLDEMERQTAELLAKLVREDGVWSAS